MKLILESDSDETISSDSECELDERNVAAGDSISVSRSLDKILSWPQQSWNSVGSIIEGLWTEDKDITPVTIFILFLLKMTQLIVKALIYTATNIQTHLKVTTDIHNFYWTKYRR